MLNGNMCLEGPEEAKEKEKMGKKKKKETVSDEMVAVRLHRNKDKCKPDWHILLTICPGMNRCYMTNPCDK